MVYSFLTTFFRVLINKSHDLLKEEIIGTMYSMASEDFDTFYSQMLPSLLNSVEVSPQQRGLLTTDLKMDRVSFFLFSFSLFLCLSELFSLSLSFSVTQDLPSFFANISKLVADCAYFKMQNTSVGLVLS